MRLPANTFAWFHRLNPRERFLTLAVAGTLFVIANLVAINFLLGAYRSVLQRNAEDRTNVLRLRVLADQQGMWNQRNDWLQATQPVLTNRDRAGTALYEQIQGIARARQVVVSALQIKPAATVPGGATAKEGSDAPQAVSVEGDTQGSWKETVQFLADVQKPENFLVFDLASLRTSPGDAKQLRCHFLISKWYAPAAK